ncbi:hypothetical protein AHMF7605_07280 [Adhaeribacter arboris]|uniref:Macroglobulin domain-containing protein n=1 Tax=Adhaeribacter arboris TaxID=2072846 RepID=A0A2T2YCW9_9BACT|nr:hypothetical protein [Adhaeribacter arboris]PSR53343.1 hypothetical protein AHMF7605_07280 [Adhaeribacter arboris]
MFQIYKNYLFTSLIWLGLLIAKPTTAQTLPEKLNTFLKERTSERLVLITDKPYYQVGDTVYFRVSSNPNTSENLVEMQLLAPDTPNPKSTKVLLKDGLSISYIILPTNGTSGDYVLRAFSPVGWEASQLIRVYTTTQADGVYKTSNWAKSGSNENLKVVKNQNNWEINWQLSGKPNESKGWFLITDFNQVIFSQEIDFSDLTGKITVPTAAITTNQVQLVLAQSSGEILFNYSLYPNESVKSLYQVQLNKNTFNLREEVKVSLVAENSSAKPANSLVSVRVLEQLDSIPFSFSGNHPVTESFNLYQSLPTYNLKKIVAASSSAPEEYIFNLKGKIVSVTDKRPIGHSLIHLIVPTSNQLEVVYSDKDGRIQVELDPFEGIKPLVFRAIQEGIELRNLEFIPDSAQSVVPWTQTYTAEAYTLAQQELITKFKILNRINQAFTLESEAKVARRSNDLKPSQLEESKLKPTTSYDLQAYEKFSNVTEIFRELIPAIEIVKRKDGVHARLYARLLKRFYTNYPLFLVDGIPSYDVETILNLPASQLVKIDVFNTSTALAPFDVLSTGGVVALYTKDRNFNPAALHDNNITVTGTAPSIVAPQFNRPEPTTPDFRPLVYWNPVLKTNANGSANFLFSTNDQIGKFVIEITTTSNNGEVKTATSPYTVEAQK